MATMPSPGLPPSAWAGGAARRMGAATRTAVANGVFHIRYHLEDELVGAVDRVVEADLQIAGVPVRAPAALETLLGVRLLVDPDAVPEEVVSVVNVEGERAGIARADRDGAQGGRALAAAVSVGVGGGEGGEGGARHHGEGNGGESRGKRKVGHGTSRSEPQLIRPVDGIVDPRLAVIGDHGGAAATLETG